MIQLGRRFAAGKNPVEKLPEALTHAMRAAEKRLLEDSVDLSVYYWTLTWLEGEPVVELDDGTVMSYDSQTNTVVILEHP